MVSQSIQTAHFINSLAQNTSLALQDQEQIDHKLERKLNALEETVISLGNQLDALQHQMRLQCHPRYAFICVTPVVGNDTKWNWTTICFHLQGVWNPEIISIDLQSLHDEILALQSAHLASLDPEAIANSLLNSLQNFAPLGPPPSQLLVSVSPGLSFATSLVPVAHSMCTTTAPNIPLANRTHPIVSDSKGLATQ